MKINGVIIEDQFAEAFRMWAGRLVVTAVDRHWLDIAVSEVCGYGASVIGCDAEAGLETPLPAEQTPDGRPGVALGFFAFNAQALAKALPNRVGQCLMTCPTTAVFDGWPEVRAGEDAARLDLGRKLRYFGDGHQKSKVLAGRRFWRIPVMDGEFVVEQSVGAVKAVGGGNFLIGAVDQPSALKAAGLAVQAIAAVPKVITPFPGGVVRSGSKVGSRYKGLFASTNDAYCPTLRSAVDRGPQSQHIAIGDPGKLPQDVRCVYEIVINGYDPEAVAQAMRQGIHAACIPGVVTISAGNYGGKLGKFHFRLREVLSA